MPLKDEILLQLENSRDTDLSGQALAEALGVSRSAVWKAINALKADGYEILSGTNRGYRLSPESDVISEGKIRRLMKTDGVDIRVYDVIDSTNAEARRVLAASNGDKPLLIVANEQTSGRGRYGRAFFSPRDCGIYFSLALKPEKSARQITGVTAYAAVCVASAVERITGKRLEIKWINDLYLGGKKVCGILTQAVSDFESGEVTDIIIGIGINVKPCDFPDELKEKADSLECEKAVKNELTADIIDGLLSYENEKESFISIYKKYSIFLGKRVKIKQGDRIYIGKAVDFLPDGSIVLETENGKRTALGYGEISDFM